MARVCMDFADPHLVRLLDEEARERKTTVEDVLSRALEAYFAERLGAQALAKVADSLFAEWSDPRDAEYDRH